MERKHFVFKNRIVASLRVAPHCYIKPFGRLGWVIHWGRKDRNLCFWLRYSTTYDRYIFEEFYEKGKENSSRYLRRLMCYPSFIEFLQNASIEPRSVLVWKKGRIVKNGINRLVH